MNSLEKFVTTKKYNYVLFKNFNYTFLEYFLFEVGTGKKKCLFYHSS